MLFICQKKNAIPLVLSIEEMSLWPELSSPPRFRIQGGWSERHGQRTEGRTEILVTNIELQFSSIQCSESCDYIELLALSMDPSFLDLRDRSGHNLCWLLVPGCTRHPHIWNNARPSLLAIFGQIKSYAAESQCDFRERMSRRTTYRDTRNPECAKTTKLQ